MGCWRPWGLQVEVSKDSPEFGAEEGLLGGRSKRRVAQPQAVELTLADSPEGSSLGPEIVPGGIGIWTRVG